MQNGRRQKENAFARIFVAVLIVLTLVNTQVSFANEIAPIEPDPFENPVLMRVTNYYSNSGHCADGTKPIPNYSCGARKDLIGCVAMVYEQDEEGNIGEFIGYYEIHDTGSHKRIQSGLSIDIYQTDLNACWDFTHKYGDWLYVKYVKGNG